VQQAFPTLPSTIETRGLVVTIKPASLPDYHNLIKNVERAVDAVGDSTGTDKEDLGKRVHTLVETAIREFRDQLGIYGGRLYQRDGKDYVLMATFADAKPLEPGLRVPRSYPPLDLCCLRGVVFIDAEDPSVDPELEAELGVTEFACIEVGEGEYILAFNIASGFDRDSILVSLGILRHAINQKFRHDRLLDVFREARKIQASILPQRAPDFGAFEMYSRSVAMESVGGDFFDYIPLTEKILGLAVADVTGHGLPAALQVRDIYTGLRMGMARDFKIVRTVERLNRIIHRSTLTSRFVSMVYGELELNGNFIYVNCGHPAPFLLRRDGSHQALREGGAVLGPIPDATYERGFVRLEPGDLLVIYTDGIVETLGWSVEADTESTGALEEYGEARMLEVVRQHQEGSAREIVDAVFANLEVFGGGRPQEDDRTLMIVRYPIRS